MLVRMNAAKRREGCAAIRAAPQIKSAHNQNIAVDRSHQSVLV